MFFLFSNLRLKILLVDVRMIIENSDTLVNQPLDLFFNNIVGHLTVNVNFARVLKVPYCTHIIVSNRSITGLVSIHVYRQSKGRSFV